MTTVNVKDIPPTITYKGREYSFSRFYGTTQNWPVYKCGDYQVCFDRYTGKKKFDTEDDTKFLRRKDG